MSRFRGGGSWARPENALKRAEELIGVGQKAAALQSLRDVITSKRSRANWSKTYEDIMFKLMDLCVEMKRRNDAKEALMQYRNMCQQVNINSLEEVIKYYLNKATEKAEEARAHAEATSLDTVEDLEEDAKPEDLMLSYVSGDKSKDRTDRELVTPWFRFLWESHRSVLEILRTNPKLEALYAMAASRAFAFCLTYKRNAEFRRLCDILRQHLANMQKYRDTRDITAPESWSLHLETRFEQLRVACELEMWGEAFRSVEDIQNLITLGKRQPKQQLMASYYSRLTQIFKVSNAQLYHAYAWLKLFTFSRSFNKNLTQADVAMMATSVVLSVLSVPAYDRALFGRQDDMAAEQERERTIKMANILGYPVDKRVDPKTILTRGALLSSISAMNLLSLVPAEVRSAYELMTQEFAPLELAQRLEPVLTQLSTIQSPMSPASPLKDLTMADYVPALRNAAVVRMVKQLSDVYSTMRISELSKLIPGMSFNEAEAQLVDAVKYGFLSMRIDHRNGTLHFGGQQLESDRVRGHLALLAKRLAKASRMIDPRPASGRAEDARRAALQLCRDHMASEHKRLLARKLLIEKRKEQQEAALLEAEREEERKRQQAAREAELLEERRRREEAARREKERLERELEEQEQAEAKALLEQAAARKKKGGVTLKEGEKIDKASLMKDVVAERLKEQAELERKLARLAKTLDHLERARREEEAPYIEEAYKKRMEEDAKLHEEQQRVAAEQHRAAWEVDIVEKRRLSRMREESDSFAATIVSRRQEEFEQLRREREQHAAERRAELKNEREIARRKEFVRRARAAVQAKVEELEAERLREELEREEAEREEQRRKQDEMAAKIRAREEEIERKLREEKAAAGAPAPAAAAAAGGGGNKFVPPALRKAMEAAAAGGGAPAAAAAPAEREGSSWRDSRAPPAAAAARDGDRWGGPRPAADRPAPERPAPAERPAAPAADRPAPSGGGGGGSRFVPPHLRKQMEAAAGGSGGAGDAPQEGRQPEGERRGGGGAYRPPSARGGGGGGW